MLKQISLMMAVAVCLFIFSCTSKQNKAENLVNEYLKTHLASGETYSSVSFSNIDTLLKRYTETPDGEKLLRSEAETTQKLKKMQDTLSRLISTSEMQYKDALKRQMQYETDTSNFAKTLRERELLFSGPVSGWDILHTYSIQSSRGISALHITRFRFDSALTKVVIADKVK
jgi:hypothetical protein